MVIHGMGEQRPMETLRSFVDAVWVKAGDTVGGGGVQPDSAAGAGEAAAAKGVGSQPADAERRIWIVPDECAGSFELRRITTGKDKNGIRTDFFEFYWADLMQGTTLQHLWAWIRGLLLRSPAKVPARMRAAWLLLWALTVTAALILLSAAFPDINPFPVPRDRFFREVGPLRLLLRNMVPILLSIAIGALGLALIRLACRLAPRRSIAGPLAVAIAAALLAAYFWAEPDSNENGGTDARLLALALAAGLGALIQGVLVPYFGDVARYVRAAPDTVERRQAVRDRGLTLLRALHKSGEYRRIIVFGHSLGAVIAYDLLLLLWAERGPSKERPPSAAVVRALRWIDFFLRPGIRWNDRTLEVFRKAQWNVFKALRESSDNWLISDFITAGSPLTHADFLIASDAAHLRRLHRERLLAKSPPIADDGSQRRSSTPRPPSVLYESAGSRIPHHAALFGAVRWTNLYDCHRAVFFGDLVSGPVRKNFGRGIRDIEVRMRRPLLCRWSWRFFTHTLYWDWGAAAATGRSEHIRHLREALDLPGDA